jgi:ABC-type phosphate transport system permease subunit
MWANVSVLSAVNPIVVYSVLGFYGILIFAVLLYVNHKFSGAAKLLNSLKKDWESAETTHKDMLTQAREHVSKLTPVPTVLNATAGSARSVNFDLRHQVMAMGRKGFQTADIARACAIPEADVDVLLGLARIQK